VGPLTPRRRARRPRLLLALRRRPRLRRVASVAVGVLVAALVHTTLSAATAERDRWERTAGVVVSAADLPAGHVLGAHDLEQRSLPVAAVPDGALASRPLGQALRHPVRRGEVLVEDRLAPGGLRGLAARLPAGHRAVALPADPSVTPPLEAGDRVDVLVSVDPTAVSGAPTFVLAPGVLVLDVGELAVTVAVPASDAPRVAFAAASGSIALALTAG
jgi:Flp pilus assembly protein CpaB